MEREEAKAAEKNGGTSNLSDEERGILLGVSRDVLRFEAFLKRLWGGPFLGPPSFLAHGR